MPDLPGCTHSPYADDPVVRGAALITGVRRYCDMLDPGHPAYHPGMAWSYRRATAALNGLPDPGPAPSPVDAPTGLREPLAPLRDEAAHARVWDAARTCIHRTTVESCCGPVERCGPGGLHAGSKVGVGLCYPCTILRLGMGDEPTVHVPRA